MSRTPGANPRLSRYIVQITSDETLYVSSETLDSRLRPVHYAQV